MEWAWKQDETTVYPIQSRTEANPYGSMCKIGTEITQKHVQLMATELS